MTESFDEWWDRFGQPYEATVIANGGTPWPLDTEKRAATATNLALPADTDPMELRRALWKRRNRKAA